MEIIVGVGINNLIFGTPMDNIKVILGEPDKESKTERENGIVYTYNHHMTKFKFDQEDGYILSSIEVHNPEILMFSQYIIGKSKEEIEGLLKLHGFNDFEYEEYDYFENLYCEKMSATFQFVFNRLRSIEFSPLFNDEGNFVWPNQVN